jgi:acetoin utilization transport system ATP-binding protein
MTESTTAIAIDRLTKRYGSTLAVDGLTLAIPQGSIFGLLGTNGAGKTTTFKCMLGLARPTEGSITFEGRPLTPDLFERLSYVPEKCALYEWMTGAQLLEMQRRSFRRYDQKRADDLMDLFALDRKKKLGRYSKGQQTAMALVLAFSIHPELLVLDEPAAGLDPVHQRHVLDLIIGESAGGATIVFSSHQIGQVERAAERVAIMHRGTLRLAGEVEQLKADLKVVEATFDDDAPSVNGLATDPSIAQTQRSGRLLRVYVKGNGDEIARTIGRSNPRSVRILDQNLEDIFLTVVGSSGAAAAADVLGR